MESETLKRAFNARDSDELQPPKRLKEREQMLELKTIHQMGQDAGISYIRGDLVWSHIEVIILKMQDLQRTCFFAGFLNSLACAREIKWKDEDAELRRPPIILSTSELEAARLRGLVK